MMTSTALAIGSAFCARANFERRNREATSRAAETMTTRFLRTKLKPASEAARPQAARLLDGYVFEQGQLVEHLAGAHDDRRKGVVGEHDRQAGFFAQKDVEIA